MFDRSEAFARNIGWLSEQELAALDSKRIAIAGLGGVGGGYLLACSRLGLGGFSISDYDVFELANFNRQAGAFVSCLGRPKIDVLAEMALDINPDLAIARFPHGIGEEQLDAFLSGVDVYLDGLDFFAMDIRELVFAACARKGIPAITAAPLGWGVSLLVFMPGGMTFEEYFQTAGHPLDEKLRRFIVGLSPEAMQLSALVDPTRLDLERRIGPSTPVGCEMCTAVAATTAIKLLLGRGPVAAVPTSTHIDAFSMKMEVVLRPRGMGEPTMQAALERLRAPAIPVSANRTPDLSSFG